MLKVDFIIKSVENIKGTNKTRATGHTRTVLALNSRLSETLWRQREAGLLGYFTSHDTSTWEYAFAELIWVAK